MQFQLFKSDPVGLKDFKYTQRIQDLEKLGYPFPVIITPDPRLRSPDRIVNMEIFL